MSLELYRLIPSRLSPHDSGPSIGLALEELNGTIALVRLSCEYVIVRARYRDKSMITVRLKRNHSLSSATPSRYGGHMSSMANLDG